MRNTRALLALLALSAVASIAFASVFVYYPVAISVQPVEPPVLLEAGSNAGQADLYGNILVTIGLNKTSAEITVHPTYQITYYKNITLIVNNDTANSYNVWIRVKTPISGTYGSAQLIVQTGAGPETIDLTSTGTYSLGTISAGASWEMDLNFTIAEGFPLPTASSAVIQVIYTTGSETPP